MALYFKDTEIANIDNLVPQTSLDIIDIWFGSTNVYTVWETYEGTLPATFNANGDDMRQYQIWGNIGGVGNDSGTAYGYEVNISTSDGTNVTTTHIYIGSDPLDKDEYVDYQAGKVYRRTAQVMPSAPAETRTKNGITVTCDGEGRYSISGTATSNVTFNFDISEFVIPTSVGNGGDGTFSIFNNFASQNFKLGFRHNKTLIDDWSAYPVNRTSTGYSTMGNKTINGISISIMSNTTINGVISPILTDNGILPETYIPHLQPTDPPAPLPALPTCEGTTIIDYSGSGAAPEKVLLKYRKEGY